MALIDPAHPAVIQSSQHFWEDELKNSYILLADFNERIHTLEIEDYSLDTGQNNQRVKRSALESLVNARAKILDQIAELEIKLGIDESASGQCIQAVPF